jgi:hypothetical protein
MEETAEVVPAELSPQLVEAAEKEIAVFRNALLASTAARSGFHEKLVVITAGSLTIVSTMATNIYVKPFADKQLNHWLLETLAISALFFFLSLIASVLHNFAETEALHLEYLAAEKGMTRKLFQAVVKESNKTDLDAKDTAELRKIVREVEDPIATAEANKLRKAERFRKIERLIGLSAVVCFIFGYLPALGFVIYLARF